MLVPRPGGRWPDRLPPGLPLPCLPAGVGFALGFAASVITTMLARLLGAASDPNVGLVLLAVTAATVGALTTPIAALGSAAQCWACYTGFLLNRLGVLTFDHRSLPAACALLASGVIPSVLASAARGQARSEHRPPAGPAVQ
jgi:hypothetical protein